MLSISKIFAVAIIASAAVIGSAYSTSSSKAPVAYLGEQCGIEKPIENSKEKVTIACRNGLICDRPGDFSDAGKSVYNTKSVCMEYVTAESGHCNALQVCINGLKCVNSKCAKIPTEPTPAPYPAPP
ncbi:hypothetical protein BDF22DRAFT_677510, partial [Syncephalis plumigaleata]